MNSLDIHTVRSAYTWFVGHNCGFDDSWRSRSESRATNGTDDGIGNGVYGGTKRRKGYT